MPPKTKITKEKIIEAAIKTVRESGADALNARALAAALQCSTQPIFSNFSSMEEVRRSVIEESEKLYEAMIRRETESGKYPPYKASGMAYIRFASEEKELFKLLYMRDRTKEVITEKTDLTDRMTKTVSENTGLNATEAELFHLEMWAYVHGIAVITATEYLTLPEELISKMLTDAYEGLKSRFHKE